MNLVDEIRAVLTDAASLEKQAAAIVRGALPDQRVGEFMESASAIFYPPDMTAGLASWRNLGPDFHLCRLGYAAWVSLENAQSFRLQDFGGGLSAPGAANGIFVPPRLFDFRWNMQVGSPVGRQYAAGANQFISRQVLGNMETGQWLEFPDDDGWIIPRGETVSFPIQPVGYWWNATRVNAAGRFTVHMLMDGYRVWQ